ncbi:hypothetical protein VPHD356_0179 [Vibrio phage D356]
MIRPYQKAATNTNIERAYDAMLDACAKQRTFIGNNKTVTRPLLIATRAQYAENIKAIIEAKYNLTVALVKPVSPNGSEDMSDSTKFIIDRLLSGDFKFTVSKNSVNSDDKDFVTYETRITATDKSIPLTITMERSVTRQVFKSPHNIGRQRIGSTKSFKLNTSIPGLFTERETEFIDRNYYDDILRTAKLIQEEVDRATEKAAAAGAIKEVTKLYKEVGLEIPK